MDMAFSDTFLFKITEYNKEVTESYEVRWEGLEEVI